MTNEERAGWIKTLKEGDQVCYQIPGPSGRNFVATSVRKITPKGRIRVCGNLLFDARGNCSTPHAWGLGPCTEDLKAQIERHKLEDKAGSAMYILNNMRSADIRMLPDDLLREIIDLQIKVSESLKKPSIF